MISNACVLMQEEELLTPGRQAALKARGLQWISSAAGGQPFPGEWRLYSEVVSETLDCFVTVIADLFADRKESSLSPLFLQR